MSCHKSSIHARCGAPFSASGPSQSLISEIMNCLSRLANAVASAGTRANAPPSGRICAKLNGDVPRSRWPSNRSTSESDTSGRNVERP
jgi:hypothetical protein